MARKRIRELREILDRDGWEDYDISIGKTHIKITIRLEGRTRKLTVSSSPSCPYSLAALERDLRKVRIEFQEGLNSGKMWSKS